MTAHVFPAVESMTAVSRCALCGYTTRSPTEPSVSSCEAYEEIRAATRRAFDSAYADERRT
jgi:hypothetical protein